MATILDIKLLYRDAVHLKDQLTVVGKTLDNLQRDDTMLSDSFEVWTEVLNDELLQDHKPAFEKRFKQAMTGPHFLANMTDPRFFGKNLSPEQEQNAEEWLQEHYPDFFPGLVALKIQDSDFFPPSVFSDSLTGSFKPSKW